MPRDVSLVTGLAALGLSAGPTHTFITPLTAALKAILVPSSLNVGPVLSGLPKIRRRGTSGTSAGVRVGGAAAVLAAGFAESTPLPQPTAKPPPPAHPAAVIATRTGRRIRRIGTSPPVILIARARCVNPHEPDEQ